MLTAAIYARYSTDKQDSRSIDDQLRRCREFAERAGYEIVAEFTDAAVSGTHTNREQLRRMIDVATATKRSPFRAVVVDDLSRLSRDIGATHSIVFGELAGASVKVLDTTGLDSESDSGEMTIAMRSIINREYIRGVSKQTHRGMTGRALGGFSTGGRVYGYRTVVEENPPDRDHPRKVFVIDDAEAAIVRRVFELFLAGSGLKAIADALNRDCVAAPHDDGRGNKGLRGWGHSTIRNVLRNERYIGRWVWNTSKWHRDTTSGKRRRVERPKAEHVVREFPELAIVALPTWDRVLAKLGEQTRSGGRPAGATAAGNTPYLTSGLLRCGDCGGSMSVIGARVKAGVRYATFGCSTHHSRGSSVCENALTISERKITRALIDSLRELFLDPAVTSRITASIAAKLGTSAKPGKSPLAAIAEVEKRIANLTDVLAARPASTAILAKLDEEERRLAELRSRPVPTRDPAAKAPTEAQVRGFLTNLAGTLEADPVAGRAALAGILSPIVLTPKTETPRGYLGRAVFRLSSSLGAAGSSAPVLEKYRSGGRI